jgi:chemotaxis protein CheC
MMVKIEDLTHLQLDVLKEIGNIGAGHATTALSQLLAEKIEMTVPDVSIMPLNEVSEVLGGPEKLVVGIYMRVFGDAPGKIIFLFTPIEALTLTDMALKWKVGTSQSLREFEESAMKEIGNIMTGAYIYALTKLTGFNLLTSVPAFACDMVGAIVNTALMDLGVVGDYTLLIKTQFSLTHRKINGHFFLVPDPGSLELIMDALGVGPICKK